MKPVLRGILTIGFSTLTLTAVTQANAQSQCVPTMTVEVAQAQYNVGFAAADADLLQAYVQATQIYDAGLATALAHHEKNLSDIQSQYDDEYQKIKSELNLGWREELEAASIRHNLATQAAAIKYQAETQRLLAEYNQSVEAAQAKFSTATTALAQQYNYAVCASE